MISEKSKNTIDALSEQELRLEIERGNRSRFQRDKYDYLKVRLAEIEASSKERSSEVQGTQNWMERQIFRIKKHPVYTIMTLMIIVVIGLAEFTNALKDINELYDSWKEPSVSSSSGITHKSENTDTSIVSQRPGDEGSTMPLAGDRKQEVSPISFKDYLKEHERYSELTSLQREQFLRLHVGKQVNWEGFVRDIETGGQELVLWFEPEKNAGIFAVASCVMPAKYRDELMAIRKGQEVRVLGTLTDKIIYGHVLEQCDLVSTSAAEG